MSECSYHGTTSRSLLKVECFVFTVIDFVDLFYIFIMVWIYIYIFLNSWNIIYLSFCLFPSVCIHTNITTDKNVLSMLLNKLIFVLNVFTLYPPFLPYSLPAHLASSPTVFLSLFVLSVRSLSFFLCMPFTW